MRVIAVACIAIAALLPLPAAAQIDSIIVHADRVAFYSNRNVVTADDNVRVTLSDGTTITGRAFEMDLKLNRFIVAGNVNLTHGAIAYQGAAFSEFLDFRRAYFLPILAEPDRWTFLDEDYAQPTRGRQMPGDAFALPEVGGEHAFILSGSARITPKTGVGFSPARIYTFGAYTPTPDYYQNFSANPNFAQNSLAGASADAAYPFAGGPSSSTTLHLRYDTTNKGYLAIEQHLVAKNAYAVFSISPLTRPQKQYNFLGSIKSASQRFQFTTFDQVSAFQYAFKQPLAATALENVQLTYALKNSYLQLTGNQYETTLLAQPQPDANGQYWYGDTGHPWIPNHPNNFQLAWIGADRRWGHTPINYRMRVGMLTAHDGFGLGSFGTTPYTSYWQHFLGFTVWTNPFKLTKRAPLDQSLYIQSTYDRQRTIVSSFPRFQDQGTLTTTLSKLNGKKGSMYLSYVVSNQGDFLGPLQQQAYPPTIINNPYDGKIYPGFAAFGGFATSRDLQFAYNYVPTAYFSFTFQGDRHQDFPAPIPYYYGNPPWAVTARTQIRLSPTISVMVQRSYYFNFGNMGWSPTWTVQFGP